MTCIISEPCLINNLKAVSATHHEKREAKQVEQTGRRSKTDNCPKYESECSMYRGASLVGSLRGVAI